MSKLRVSLFVHDLAGNAIVRAAPLARALREEGHEVEILGFLLSGDEVYWPFRREFEYRTLRVTGPLKAQIARLASLATGQVIYACKPSVTTLAPALLASGFARDRPLLLDAEDDELWIDETLIPGRGVFKRLRKYWLLRYTYALHPFTSLVSGTTVVSRRLQRRYGGLVVLHGPDATVFDPARAELDRRTCCAQFGLDPRDLHVLFAGVPQPHKGLDTLVRALQETPAQAIRLVLAGNPDHPTFAAAASALPGRTHRVGLVDLKDMPALVAACAISATPQKRNAFTSAQIPAKLLEGMAMARFVVASRVSDLPQILGEGTDDARGWLHEPGDWRDLARCLGSIGDDPAEALRRADAARRWFVANASAAAIRRRLAHVLRQCAPRSPQI